MGILSSKKPEATKAQMKVIKKAKDPVKKAAKMKVSLPKPTNKQLKELANARGDQAYRTKLRKFAVEPPSMRDLTVYRQRNDPSYTQEGRSKRSGRYKRENNPHVIAAQERQSRNKKLKLPKNWLSVVWPTVPLYCIKQYGAGQ